jgi:2-phosphoglycerate kinase
MSNRVQHLRVILIGGSSHAGKTSLGQALASKLGWRHISTDSLARHPGRPWKNKSKAVPRHVAEHYLSLTAEELLADVLRHYKNMWQDIEAMISLHANDSSADQLILEGSALWPESVASLSLEGVAAIWLTASDDLFESRIHNESNFKDTASHDKKMIQKFLERTHLYDRRMLEAVTQFGLVSIDIETTSSLEELTDTCLQKLDKLNAAT